MPRTYMFGVALNGHRAQEVAAPLIGTDAANKQYVDVALRSLTVRQNSDGSWPLRPTADPAVTVTWLWLTGDAPPLADDGVGGARRGRDIVHRARPEA